MKLIKDRLRAIRSLIQFMESAHGVNRDRTLAPLEDDLQAKIAAIFGKQSGEFLKGLVAIKPHVDAEANEVAESISQSDWFPHWNDAADKTFSAFSDDMGEEILQSMILGGDSLFEMTNTDAGELGISWNLENPRAVAYAEQQAAAQVTLINDSTRATLNSLISEATAQGTSYSNLAKLIEDKFAFFATGGDNPRSKRIAVFELGDAYEAGNEAAANEIEDAGIELQKKWITVGDDKVRPTHTESQGQGFHDLDFTFASGEKRSPTDPGCRCVMIYRRKQ